MLRLHRIEVGAELNVVLVLVQHWGCRKGRSREPRGHSERDTRVGIGERSSALPINIRTRLCQQMACLFLTFPSTPLRLLRTVLTDTEMNIKL